MVSLTLWRNIKVNNIFPHELEGFSETSCVKISIAWFYQYVIHVSFNFIPTQLIFE